jgi:hypothetical protein
MATKPVSENRETTHAMSVGELIDRAVQQAVVAWLDMYGEEIIAAAAQKSMNAWFMLYDDQIIPGLAKAIQHKLREPR